MKIAPVQGFKNLSTKKKIAVVAGAAAGVALVATAAIKGKGSDAFTNAQNEGKKLNIFKTLGEGFKIIGKEIANKFSSVKAKITEKGGKVAEDKTVGSVNYL